MEREIQDLFCGWGEQLPYYLYSLIGSLFSGGGDRTVIIVFWTRTLAWRLVIWNFGSGKFRVCSSNGNHMGRVEPFPKIGNSLHVSTP